MKDRWWLVVALGWTMAVSGAAPDGDAILAAVDRNIGSDTKVSTARMVIEGRRGSRTVLFKSWIRGMDESSTEYLDPPRERGVKMLKLGDQLWAYYPATDRTIKISGHMLRQSVMGSDLSYEDLMEDPLLSGLYDPQVEGEEVVLERPCWVLHLTAKRDDLAYDSRKMWVDKERFVILREHRFAKSGKLLKTTDVMEVAEIDGRWIGKTVEFKDALKSGGGTRFVIDTIEFDAVIPEHMFTKAVLRK
jgi:outer membrane lipoprotein-sorting protein